jgi:hypothetical protein
MTVSEQDFFDEDGTAMKLNEVLENVCKLLSWTCVDYRGSLYFVDYDHTGTYLVYDSTFTAWGATTTSKSISVQDIGFKGGDHTLDILGGYTKVKVKDSNYPVGDIFPEETWNAIAQFNGDNISSPCPVIKEDEDGKQLQVSQPTTKFNVFDHTSKGVHSQTYTGKQLPYTNRSWYLGSRLVRLCDIRKDTESITYDNCLEIDLMSINKDSSTTEVLGLPSGLEIFSFKGEMPCTSFADGCFYLSGQIAQSYDPMNHTFSSTAGSTFKIDLNCKLSVGGKYWDGSSWVGTESTFQITVIPTAAGYTPIPSKKTLNMPYSGASGYIIPIGQNLRGIIDFRMYTPTVTQTSYQVFLTTALLIKDFSMKYKKRDDTLGIESSNTDRTYENIVNGSYVTSADDIEFKISSYNNDGACYSKVMFGSDYLKDNLYSVIEDKLVRPEEALIRRIINRYSSTKIKLTQQIQFTPSLLPIDTLSDNYFVNKKFLNIGGEIDYSVDRFSCKMIEQ